jgi:4-hydroxy-tetrahydrodipicolinate synthase
VTALKAAIANWARDPAWTTVRPPLVPLTAAEAADLVTKLEHKDFQMPGLAGC